MDLRQFIRTTLVDILGGVADAQGDLQKTGLKGAINPVWGDSSQLYEHVQNVTFDVAVTVSESEKAEGGGGIKVLSVVEAKGTIQNEQSDSRVSRVSFSVPIVPSYTQVSDVSKLPKSSAAY